MKAIINVAGAVLLGIFMAGIARADDHGVTVVGKGEIKHKPDVAYVTLFVKGDALTLVDAAKEVDQKVNAVKKALEKYKEIITIEVTDMSVGEFERQVVSPDEKQGYHPEMARRIRISTLPDLTKIYPMIDTATSAGALLDVSSSMHYAGETERVVVYALLKSEKAEEEARRLALADAKRQAESLTAMAGKKIGGVVRIETNSDVASSISMQIMGQDADFSSAYYGQKSEAVAVGVYLTVTFELKEP
jgi:uncharacterized protein YggE